MGWECLGCCRESENQQSAGPPYGKIKRKACGVRIREVVDSRMSPSFPLLVVKEKGPLGKDPSGPSFAGGSNQMVSTGNHKLSYKP